MSNEQIGKVVVNSTTSPVNNIVSGEKLREVQSRVLRDLKNAIINSMGPMGSNTLILRGTSDADIVAEYSKDGNKIIKSNKTTSVKISGLKRKTAYYVRVRTFKVVDGVRCYSAWSAVKTVVTK